MMRDLYIYAVILAFAGLIGAAELNAFGAMFPSPDLQTASVQP